MKSLNLHVGRKEVESLVEVVHLHEDANSRHDHENIGTRVSKLVIAAESKFDRNAKTFDRHDADGADQGTDRDINDRGSSSIFGRYGGYHDDGEDQNDGAIEEKC